MSWTKVVNWVKNQDYTKAQIEGVSRSQLGTIAENQGVVSDSMQMKLIMSRHRMLQDMALADWRAKRVEAGRVVLENKVHEYDAEGLVEYMGHEYAVEEVEEDIENGIEYVAPKDAASVFLVKIDLNLE